MDTAYEKIISDVNSGFLFKKREKKVKFEFAGTKLVFTWCRSPGCKVDTAAVLLVADKILWCMAGTRQEIHTALSQDSTCTEGCLGGIDKKLILLFIFAALISYSLF